MTKIPIFAQLQEIRVISWNVIRSESDELMFRHAEKCGAKVFDGVKVDELRFASIDTVDARITNGNAQVTNGFSFSSHGQPVAAIWSRRSDQSSSTIQFDYVVDASGRAGVLEKYNKSRTFNKELNSVASWAYWKGTGIYAFGTDRANSPYFEALQGT